MNKHTAQLLEQHFDTAFAAPDGIAKLRELILTLAMQGKLVEQDPNDAPASELLKEIEAEKQQLLKAGKIKQPKPLLPIKPEDVPYELPNGWEWVRLGEIGIINPRNDAQDSEVVGFVPMPLIPEGYSEKHRFEERLWSEIKKGYTHFADGDVGMAKITPCFENAKSCVFSGLPNGIGAGTTELHIFRNTFNSVVPRFLLYYLKNPHYISSAVPKMTGSAGQKRVPTPYFAGQPFPIPPIQEQRRIVARIDQLMVRCDELEKLRKAREAQRLAVHAAAIKQLLDTPDGSAWDFIQQHFGELYTVKENVAELRKAIQQLAVMGRLVPQDPNDPPASELLKEIEAEKQRLVKAGKIKKTKPLPPIKPEDVPYELQQGWEWVMFEDVVDIGSGITKGRKLQGKKTVEMPYLRVANVQRGYLDLKEIKKIEVPVEETEKYRLINGDLLITEGGDWDKVGRTSIWREEVPICGHQNHVFRARKLLSDQNEIWLEKYLNSPVAREYFASASKQTTNLASINKTQLRSCPVPVPPLPEQQKIVEKIDRIMALCDTLEQQIDAATAKQSELLTALLNAQPQQHTDIIDLSTYRSAIGCYAVGKLANTQYFGRTAAAKVMYLAQAHVGLTLDFHPEREAAGPLDKWIYDFERQGQSQGWFEVNEKTLASGRKKTEYRCLPALLEPAAKAESLMSVEQQAEFDRLIYALADKKTEDVEIIATLFAVWNDFLIDGIQPTDEQIIVDVRENWHERKARFSPSDLRLWLAWLRRENLIPRGLPPRTVQQQRLGI